MTAKNLAGVYYTTHLWRGLYAGPDVQLTSSPPATIKRARAQSSSESFSACTWNFELEAIVKKSRTILIRRRMRLRQVHSCCLFPNPARLHFADAKGRRLAIPGEKRSTWRAFTGGTAAAQLRDNLVRTACQGFPASVWFSRQRKPTPL